MTRTWFAHLSLPCTPCVTLLPCSTCGWEHFGCHGTDGTLHSLLCSSDNLYFRASRGLVRWAWNCRFQWVAVFLMKTLLFLLRHCVFKKTEQHAESLGASALTLTLFSVPKKGSSLGGKVSLPSRSWHASATLPCSISFSSDAPQEPPKDALGTLKCQDGVFSQKVTYQGSSHIHYSLSTQTPRKRLFTNLWCAIMVHPTCDGLCHSDYYAVSLRLNQLLALLIILTACL